MQTLEDEYQKRKSEIEDLKYEAWKKNQEAIATLQKREETLRQAVAHLESVLGRWSPR